MHLPHLGSDIGTSKTGHFILKPTAAWILEKLIAHKSVPFRPQSQI
jgi:hypothetical protein